MRKNGETTYASLCAMVMRLLSCGVGCVGPPGEVGNGENEVLRLSMSSMRKCVTRKRETGAMYGTKWGKASECVEVHTRVSSNTTRDQRRDGVQSSSSTVSSSQAYIFFLLCPCLLAARFLAVSQLVPPSVVPSPDRFLLCLDSFLPLQYPAGECTCSLFSFYVLTCSSLCGLQRMPLA